MDIVIVFIRHGIERDGGGFFGVTDSHLSEKGKKLIRNRTNKNVYPSASLVFSSCLTRCLETAEIIFPSVPIVALQKLNAPDYGDFEGKSYTELADDERFKSWVDSPGIKACPNGEEPFAVMTRSVSVFKNLCEEAAGKGLERIAVISHKLIMQAILQRYHVPRGYKDWQIEPAGGYILQYDTLASSVKIVDKL